jgi:F0F1-type ATP synthase membrane subunit c/vacuolar-type H+-ATPase subunit K
MMQDAAGIAAAGIAAAGIAAAMNNNEGRSTYTSLYISLFIIEVFPI